MSKTKKRRGGKRKQREDGRMKREVVRGRKRENEGIEKKVSLYAIVSVMDVM